MNSSNLESVLHRVVKGDQLAFREIFESFSPKVYGFALKLTHSEELAQEVVQDVFMKIWVSRESLSTVNYFPSYLYTVTRNHAFNMMKRLALEQRVKENIRKEISEVHEDPQETSVYQDYHHMLVHAISQLPPQQRLVYSLCHQKGLKYDEVARELNISRLTVKTHMQKALRTIKSHFKAGVTFLALIFLSL